MRITQSLAMASALLLAAGCAHEQENARYDENISPAYSEGRMSDYNKNKTMSSSRADSVGAAANAAEARSGSQSDNSIVASVRESLQRNPEIAPIVSNIQISANNGAVILSGSVQSEEQKRQIEALAQQATGVVAINNQLQVVSSPVPHDPGMENQANPLLNPTSVGGNNPPALYQNAGSGTDNSNTNARAEFITSRMGRRKRPAAIKARTTVRCVEIHFRSIPAIQPGAVSSWQRGNRSKGRLPFTYSTPEILHPRALVVPTLRLCFESPPHKSGLGTLKKQGSGWPPPCCDLNP